MNRLTRLVLASGIVILCSGIQQSSDPYSYIKPFQASSLVRSGTQIAIPIPQSIRAKGIDLSTLKLNGQTINSIDIDPTGRYILIPSSSIAGGDSKIKLTDGSGSNVLANSEVKLSDALAKLNEVSRSVSQIMGFGDSKFKIPLPDQTSIIGTIKIGYGENKISAKIEQGNIVFVVDEDLKKILQESDTRLSIIVNGKVSSTVTARVIDKNQRGNVYIATRDSPDNFQIVLENLIRDKKIDQDDYDRLSNIDHALYKKISSISTKESFSSRVCGKWVSEVSIPDGAGSLLESDGVGKIALDPTTTMYPDAPKDPMEKLGTSLPRDQQTASGNRYRELERMGLYGSKSKSLKNAIAQKIESKRIKKARLHIIDSWQGGSVDSYKYFVKQALDGAGSAKFENIGHGIIVRRIAEYIGGNLLEYIPHNVCNNRSNECNTLRIIEEICSIANEASRDKSVPHIINLSLGSSKRLSVLNDSILDALDSNVTVVMSSGNTEICEQNRKFSCTQYPADYLNEKNSSGGITPGSPTWDGAYSVAASYEGNRAPFNRSPDGRETATPSIIAPGVFFYGNITKGANGKDEIDMSPVDSVDQRKRAIVVRAGASYATPVFAAALGIWRECNMLAAASGKSPVLSGPTRNDISWKVKRVVSGRVDESPYLNIEALLSNCMIVP